MDSQNSNKRTFEKFEEGIPENSQASDKKKANLAVEHTCDQEECECCGLGEVELDEEAIKDMTARELFEAAIFESKHLEKAEFPVLVKLFETALEKYENAWESEKIKLNDPKNVDCEKIKTVELGIEYLECKNAFFEFLRTVVDKSQLIEVIDFIQNSLNEFSSVSQNKPEKEILERISLGKLKFYGQKFKTEVLIELVENEKWKLIDESDDEADSEEQPENMIENASQLVFNNDKAVNTQDFKIPSIKDFSQQNSSCMSSAIIDNLVGTMSAMLPEDVEAHDERFGKSLLSFCRSMQICLANFNNIKKDVKVFIHQLLASLLHSWIAVIDTPISTSSSAKKLQHDEQTAGGKLENNNTSAGTHAIYQNIRDLKLQFSSLVISAFQLALNNNLMDNFNVEYYKPSMYYLYSTLNECREQANDCEWVKSASVEALTLLAEAKLLEGNVVSIDDEDHVIDAIESAISYLKEALLLAPDNVAILSQLEALDALE